MGYDEPKVGLDYEGSHHSENRRQYVYDIGRADLIDRQGWIDIRVVKEHSRAIHHSSSARGICQTRVDSTEICTRVVIPRQSLP